MTNDPDPVGEPDNPAAEAMPYWEQVVGDMEATAEEYRERGWDAHEVHPGDVGVFADKSKEGRTGIDLLAPDNEFDPVAEAFDAADGFENAKVFRADTDNTLFFVVALESEATETAVLLPAYYSPRQHEEFMDMIYADGEVRIHVRPLNERRILTFRHEDPSLFLPDGEESGDGAEA
jgi:hypothetical protein